MEIRRLMASLHYSNPLICFQSCMKSSNGYLLYWCEYNTSPFIMWTTLHFFTSLYKSKSKYGADYLIIVIFFLFFRVIFRGTENSLVTTSDTVVLTLPDLTVVKHNLLFFLCLSSSFTLSFLFPYFRISFSMLSSFPSLLLSFIPLYLSYPLFLTLLLHLFQPSFFLSCTAYFSTYGSDSLE